MSDKVRMSVSCVQCGKHSVDYQDTLEQKHWKDLDEHPLCPECAGENAELDRYYKEVKGMVQELHSIRTHFALMLSDTLLKDGPMQYETFNDCAITAFDDISKTYHAVKNLSGVLHSKMNTNIMGTTNF